MPCSNTDHIQEIKVKYFIIFFFKIYLNSLHILNPPILDMCEDINKSMSDMISTAEFSNLCNAI